MYLEMVRVDHAFNNNDEFVVKSLFNGKIYIKQSEAHSFVDYGYRHNGKKVIQWKSNPAEFYDKYFIITDIYSIRELMQ